MPAVAVITELDQPIVVLLHGMEILVLEGHA
jgi:uncharacterized protein YhhL (DUF1145 family)